MKKSDRKLRTKKALQVQQLKGLHEISAGRRGQFSTFFVTDLLKIQDFLRVYGARI